MNTASEGGPVLTADWVASSATRDEERLAAWRVRYGARVAEALRRVEQGETTVYDAAILAAALEGKNADFQRG